MYAYLNNFLLTVDFPMGHPLANNNVNVIAFNILYCNIVTLVVSAYDIRESYAWCAYIDLVTRILELRRSVCFNKYLI